MANSALAARANAICFSAVFLVTAASIAKGAGYTDISVRDTPDHQVRFTSGRVVYVEGLIDGRWVGRYWSAGGRINVPYELYADNAFELQIDNHWLSAGWDWAGAHELPKTDRGARHFVVELKNNAVPVTLQIHTLIDGTPVLVRWLEIANTSPRPEALYQISPWAGRLWKTRRFNDAIANGSNVVFNLGTFTRITHEWEGWFDWKPLVNETGEVESHVGHGFKAPFFIARNEAAGESFIGHLAWSANWSMSFKSEQDSTGNEANLWFKIGPWSSIPQRVIAPGESVDSPAIHLGHVEGDLDAAVQAMDDHVRGFVMPPRDPKRADLIQYAVPGDQGYSAAKPGDVSAMTEKSMLDQVDLAASVGAELFIVDAGWWDNYGDWSPSPERFPRGLDPVREYARSKGMLFGLYNEVEGGRGDWTHSRLYKEHPDWFIAPYALIDLTKPDAAAYVEAESERQIDKYKLDLFRLDYNPGFDYEMAQTDRDGIPENDYWRYYQVFYKMFERIRSRHPEVILQQAAAGGGRNDLGTVSRFDEQYTTDGLDIPPALQNFSGQTLGLPPENFLNAFGIPDFSSNRGPLDTHLRISFSLATPWLAPVAPSANELAPEIRQEYLHYAEIYKTFIRPLLPTCKVYHHAPVSSTGGVESSPWFALEFASPDRTQGWATIVRLHSGGPDSYVLKLRGVDPGRRYRVTFDSKGSTATIDGVHLQEGLPIRLESELSSELLLFAAITEQPAK
jgi:alpha-galactosidase